MYTPFLQTFNSHVQDESTRIARPSSASGSNSSAATPAEDLTNTFLLLLTVQLKNQSPIDPLDPNQFIAQLAQFNSLGELTQIQQLMQTLVNQSSTKSH